MTRTFILWLGLFGPAFELERKHSLMAGDARAMARRLTTARKAKGLDVDQIYAWLVEQRMTSKSPKKSPLWIGTVRRWFHYGLDEVPREFQVDFDRICWLLGIPSINDLWIDVG
jgi:hypothetical protein